MGFFETYQNISDKEEKQMFRNNILELCEIQFTTFYFWKKRNRVPLKHHKKIAAFLNISQNELFPKIKKQ